MKKINKRSQKGNDDDHEIIKPPEMEEIDEEAYGRPVEDVLDNEKTNGISCLRTRRRRDKLVFKAFAEARSARKTQDSYAG